MTYPRVRRWREALALLVFCAPFIALYVRAPIVQPQDYHAFAGDGAGALLPNLSNVASNLAFLLVGAAGLAICRRAEGARGAWSVFFLGITLVTFGSAYYHWAPNDATLVWDRLPMAIAFMGMFVALLAEHLAPRLERALLVPAVVVGIASVAWWGYSGDLRLYLAVQIAALLSIPLFLALYPARYSGRAWLVAALAIYGAAKAAEFNDREVYALTGGLIAGHPLKHLLAALALACVAWMLARRRAVAPVSESA